MRKIVLALGLLYATAAIAGGESGPNFNRGQIPGGGGTAPAAGNIGQVLTSTVACSATTGLTSGTMSTITTVSLTAGTWTLSGLWAFNLPAGTTAQYVYGGIASSSYGTGTPGTTQFAGGYGYGQSGPISFESPMIYYPAVTVASTTTYYLNINASFSGGTAGPCGSLQAVRIA
jgi:hypothetical protein